MARLGTRVYGYYVRVPDNHQVVAGQIYETRGYFNADIPEDIALSMIKDWRDELQVKEGIVTNYIEVSGKNFILQWKVYKPTGYSSQATLTAAIPWPVIIETILTIIKIAVVAVAVYYGLKALEAVIKETGQVLSILGPENVSMITNVLFMFVFLMMFSPLISMIAELPRRLIPPKEAK